MTEAESYNYEKGMNYERLVAEYFQKLGYITIKTGSYEDKKTDYKIDVIAIKQNVDISINPLDTQDDKGLVVAINKNPEREILFIQCKNWDKNSPKINKYDINEIIKQHKNFRKYKLWTDESTSIIKSYLIVAEPCVEYETFKKYKANDGDIIIKHLSITADGSNLEEISHQ